MRFFFQPIICIILLSFTNVYANKIENNCEIKIGNFNWDSSIIHSNLVKKIIENGFDCKTKILEIDNYNVLEKLNNNEIDIVMEFWSKKDIFSKKIKKNLNIVNIGESSFAYDQLIYIDKATSSKFNIKTINDVLNIKNNEIDNMVIFLCPKSFNCYWLNNAKIYYYGINNFKLKNFDHQLLFENQIKFYLDNNYSFLFFYNEPSSLIGKYYNKIQRIEEQDFNQDCKNKELLLIEDLKKNTLENINNNKYCSSKSERINLYKIANKNFLKNNEQIKVFLNKYFLNTSNVNNLLKDYVYNFNGDIDKTINYFIENNDIWHNWVNLEIRNKILAVKNN